MTQELQNFKEKIIHHFKNESEMNTFLNKKTSAFGGKSPSQFLKSCRRPDKYEFAENTINQLKSTLDISYE